MQQVTLEQLTQTQKKLLDAALHILENSYNPYSQFSVGAALLTSGKEIITGTNVENAAYGAAICAERSAIVRANAMGFRYFKSLAVVAKTVSGSTTEITTPCGICRQVLFEFAQLADEDMEVVLATTDKSKIVVTSIYELLPLGFGPRDLGIDIQKYLK